MPFELADQPQPLPRIKVCGVTRESDLELLLTAGVDTVGINLVPSSSRCVDLARAKDLVARAKSLGLLAVAVVMNAEGEQLSAIASAAAWDFIQLHGNELPQAAANCEGIAIIKALSWSGRAAECDLAQQWRRYQLVSGTGDEQTPGQAKLGSRANVSQLRAFLVDAYAPGVGGGTGKTAPWQLLQPRPSVLAHIPLLLAGGLKPANIGDAIHAVLPDGVDTASGVESSPGIKSAQLVREFASNALSAFEEAQG